jgi:hypothetical protein
MESPEGSSKDLATFSATEKVCTVKIFLIIFRRNVLNEKRKMSDESITVKIKKIF